NLDLDYILYDISGDIPCTGFILPMRDGVMQKCIVVTNSSFPALVTANSMIAGIVRASKHKILPIGLLVNFADVYPARTQLTAYAEAIQLEEIAYLDYFQKIEYSELAGKTVLAAYPDSAATEAMMKLAKKIIEAKEHCVPKPLERKELLNWLSQWKQRSLAQKSGIIGIDDSSNI
ncbi:MAG: nitrogenase iron protein, partial [Firmicutes bacterium]|nr:nitrogenase iron protein [Bacillota bacterium]